MSQDKNTMSAAAIMLENTEKKRDAEYAARQREQAAKYGREPGDIVELWDLRKR